MKTHHYQTLDDLPLMLSPLGLAQVLGISRMNAYNLCKTNTFPVIRLGRRILIPRDRLLLWLDQQGNAPHHTATDK